MSMIDEFDFSANEGASVAKEANKGGDFQKEIEFLSLKGDEASINQGLDQAIIRLVTEYERKPWMTSNTAQSLPWITVKQHYAPTKQRPAYAREGSRWPEKMYVGCRKDKVFSKKFNGQCLVCEQGHKPSDRTWALAIEREQIIENGRPVGMRDKTREVLVFGEDGKPIVVKEGPDGKKEYQKKIVPAWVVLNFGWKNFFNALSGQASYFQTIMGRDYVVKRTGSGNNDTNYTFIPLDPIKIEGQMATDLGVNQGTPYDMGYIVGTVDGRDVPLSELLYPDMPDLRKIISERVSDDYFGRWFTPGWVPEGFDPSAQGNTGGGQSQGVQGGVQSGYQPTGGVQQPPAPTTPAPQQQGSAGGAATTSALDALKARVQSGKS